ncbi:MAG: hypothetical protein R8G01_14975 [Ilumatobacteraceae bacterium]|nr:hypothetical protein [Ilumatobacteraceae bacterium]
MNPLGAKGIGEAATIGSTPAIQNAVIDALAHLGVRHIDLRCTPERVWRAASDARRGATVDPWREPPGDFERSTQSVASINADVTAGTIADGAWTPPSGSAPFLSS